MRVAEIFHSLQGEGVYSCVPMNFIRLQGCNLHPDKCCTYCDTKYAQNPHDDNDLTIPEILSEVARVKKGNVCWWYCITGGEPLFQVQELRDLIGVIKGSGGKIEVETNGTIFPPGWYMMVDSWVVDCKCPSSGVDGRTVHSWRKQLRKCDQLKFVVGDQGDLDFVKSMIGYYWGCSILVSPVHPSTQEFRKEVINFCLQYNVRMSIQLHKILEVK